MKNDILTFLVEYEVRSSWWAQYISSNWVQSLAGSYFSWKVAYKYERYLKSKEISKKYVKHI